MRGPTAFLLAWIPDDHLVDGDHHFVHELIEDRLLDQQAGAGETDLPGIRELLADGARRRLEIGVGTHDERGFAAEFETDGREMLRRSFADHARSRGGAREADPAHIRMARECVARLGTGAVQDVDHTVGDPGSLSDLPEQRQAQRGELRRLDHDSVAGRESRADLPGPEHERRIPRHDERTDSRRVVPNRVVHDRTGDRVVNEGHCPVGEELDVQGGARHAASVATGEQSPVVIGVDLLQVVEAFDDCIGEPVEHEGTSGGSEGSPRRECGLRRGDRGIGLGGTAAWDLAEPAAVDRADHLVAVGSAGPGPLASDEVAGRDGDAVDLDPPSRVHWRSPLFDRLRHGDSRS